jgi:hypothetical protein
MKDVNRKIQINDISKKGGVILESKFGEKSDPIFDNPINNIDVTFEIIKP